METPIDPKAEYGHSPDDSNVAVSDASAESNVTGNTETNRRAEKKPAGAEKSIEGQEIREPRETSAASGTELEQTSGADEAVGTNAVSMPPESESNTTDTAEAIPDFQKPHPEVHTHEAQNGDESDHLKAEYGSTHPEVHAIDTNSAAEEPVSVETNRSQTGGGEMPSETNLAPFERETASEARDVRPEPETKPLEGVDATPDDSEASSPEVLNIEPVETTHDSPSTEAAGREVEENIEVNSYVPETQGTTPTFISTDSFAEGKGVEASEKGYLAVSEDTQVQGADDENVSLAEIPESSQK
jgi:hypothetical protein